MAYGKEKKFKIEVKEFNSEKVKTLTLKGRNILKQKDKKNTLNTIIIKNEFDYYSISDSVFYLSIPNFYSLDDFETFYEKVFKIIKEKNTKHLIIDVQNNIGGEEGNENLLASYLFKEAFQKYESVIIPIAAYDNFKKSKSAIADGWALSNNIPHRGKFTLMSDYFSEFGYKKPNQELVYTGKVYVLTSGVTFSGGAEFASMLKMTNRAVFIGEETGGAYEGNVSGESGDLKLPKTKIKVSIPIVHFKMAVHPEIKGRGVMPDYKVSQDWGDIIKGKNSKLEFALKLIEKNTR
jgi:C-terminal processing protease CtpA/Prc